MIAFPPVSESSSYLIVLSQATGLCTEELEKLRGEIALIAVMYGCDAEANREDLSWSGSQKISVQKSIRKQADL
jgi:hypothetical protein